MSTQPYTHLNNQVGQLLSMVRVILHYPNSCSFCLLRYKCPDCYHHPLSDWSHISKRITNESSKSKLWRHNVRLVAIHLLDLVVEARRCEMLCNVDFM